MEQKPGPATSIESHTSRLWQSRSLFLSSTFKDMQSERDYLRTHVFPRIQEQLYERLYFLEAIDLRQGVENIESESEEERELRVLKVCLEEIRLCKPYVIVLLGDRYGWVPPRERMASAVCAEGFEFDPTDKSVTALEIEFGLSTQEALDSQRIFFFFRNPLDWQKIPEGLRADYNDDFAIEQTVRERKSRLADLKRWFLENPTLRDRVFTYTATWDASRNRVSGLEEFGNTVFDALWPALDEDTQTAPAEISSDIYETENQYQAAFFGRLSHWYVPRPCVQDQLFSFAMSDSLEFGPWAVCITGPDGSGKSSLAAVLLKELEGRKGCLVLSHCAGVSPDSASVDKCLLRWINKLQQRTGSRPNLSKRPSAADIDDTFYQLVKEVTERERLVIVLDALDQFDQGIRSRYLTWLDHDRWPENALFICTSRPGDETDTFLAKPGTYGLQLPPLDGKEVESIASLVWERHHRQPPAPVIAALSVKCLAPEVDREGSPLWLTVASEYLNNLDTDDFAVVEDRQEGNAAERIVATMIDITKAMPTDVPGLFALLFDRAEKYFGGPIVKSFLALLLLGRSGWRSHDLEHLFPRFIERFSDSPPPIGDVVKHAFLNHAKVRFDPRYEYAETVEQATSLRVVELRSFFMPVLNFKPLQRLDFSHQTSREAALRHLSLSENDRQDLHKIIVAYLIAQRQDDPVRSIELGFHLVEADSIVWLQIEYGTSMTACRAEIDAITDILIAKVEKHGLPWLTNITVDEIFVDAMDSQGCDHLDESFRKDIRRDIVKGWSKRLLEEVLGRLHSSVPEQEKLELLQRLIQNLKAVANDFPNDQDLSNTLVHALSQRSWIQLNQHNFAEARSSANKAIEDLQAKPSHDRCVLLMTQADIELCQGDFGKAQEFFKEANSSLKALVEEAPSDNSLLRTLGVTHDKLGDIALTYSDLRRAEEDYVKALNIFRQLPPAHPNALRDLALCLSKLGYLKIRTGELNEAEKLLFERFQITELLAKKAPQDMEAKRDLSGAYGGLQMLSESKGDAKAALKYAKASLDLMEKVTSLVGANVSCSLDLAGAHYMFGKALKLRGDEKSAQQHFVESARRTIALYDTHSFDLKGLNLLFQLNQELVDSIDLDTATEISLRAIKEARLYPNEAMKPSVGTASINIAAKLLDVQNNNQAERLCKSLSEFWQEVTGESSQGFLATTNLLGIIDKRRGNLQSAEKKYRTAYSGFRRIFGENHPATQAAKGNLDWVLNRL